MAEALVARKALNWLKFHYVQHVVMETDALMLVHAISSPMLGCLYFDFLVQDIKMLLTKLVEASIVHVKKSVN